MVTINASEFKAKCLAILDEVADTGEAVMILKRGRPVAQLVPPPPSDSTPDTLRMSFGAASSSKATS
jgi:prevent-host-death family protein